MAEQAKSGTVDTKVLYESSGIELTSDYMKHIRRLLREEDAHAATVDRERDRLIRTKMYE